MKYTFIGKENVKRTIDIPEDFIERTVKSLGCTPAEACSIFLSDEGYIENTKVQELTEKAKSNGRRRTSQRTKSIKREFVKVIAAALNDCKLIDEVFVINPDRQIQFTAGSDVYEICLSKKRR